jgi:multidrug resistance efflux pump
MGLDRTIVRRPVEGAVRSGAVQVGERDDFR